MRLTAEIRWFWPDRPPQEFHGWFVGAGTAWTATGSTKTRVDEYLRDPDQDSLGIKKRGRGDVEIKGLISRRDKHLDFAGCTSPIELWASVSCRRSQSPNSQAATRSGPRIRRQPRSNPMPILKLTISDREPIWINLDKVLAVGPTTRGMDMSLSGGASPGSRIYVDTDTYWSVRESVEDVVAKIEHAKDRP